MRFLKIKTITPCITSATLATRPKLRRRILQVLAVTTTLVGAFCVNRKIAQTLSEDTRVVLRMPRSVFAELTQDSIREEFTILEQSSELEVTGTAVATGRVSIDLEPDSFCPSPGHAVFAVHVVGETEKSLIGRQASVQILGTGRGTFAAVKRIHFDGRGFHADEATEVAADHETEINDVKAPMGGPFRLLASRKAREAIPLVNEVAVQRIKERVGARVDEMVERMLQEWNLLDRLKSVIAQLHPATSVDWRISFSASDHQLQAALIPGGGGFPELPDWKAEGIEVWMRLTPSQRFGVSALTWWKEAHWLFGGVMTDEQAERLAPDLRISEHDGWTRVRLAAGSINVATAPAGISRS